MKAIEKEFKLTALRSEESLKELAGKTIFISGATGFFGKWLLGTLIWANQNLDSNIKILALSRDPEKFLAAFPGLCEGIFFIKGDIKKFDFPEENIDYIFHAATEASAKLNTERPEIMFEDIMAGMKHILNFAINKKIKGMLHTSSGAVYGKQPPEIKNLAESYIDFHDPVYNAYSEGKRSSELLANKIAKENSFSVVHARCFAFGGEFLPLDTHFAIGNFVLDCLNNRDINITGDGSPYRSYMYSGDLIVWLLRLLVSGRNQEFYNVGSPEEISIKDLAKEVVSFFPELKVNIAKEVDESQAPARYVPDVSKVQKEFSLEIKYNIKDIISKIIEFNKHE